ncbi:MAG: TIGR03620 family F420-dependent LLM class oxidoreductase [Acidimicrobiales bacterium]|jgi:probable F420-dependent oxidoreductase|nr:TIGR03620 family F420-dependent LLM class oxidoreductase [Acidimicrobiales bacterium]MDP6299378.1 TIGR03620 family F420-dependent LLM class oxidoreductase [Acidimicrobiales bacterium]HJM97471.1 TIGR03620 family F420-dependent LLM class oxidoreductase [Acidimicrobiales bacterium]
MKAKEIGSRGIWFPTDGMESEKAIEFVKEIESLGYSTLWIPETTGRDPFAHIAMLLENTTEIVFATGIANIYHRHPGSMRQAASTLAEQSKGRFILGLGVSHEPLVSGLRQLEYLKPIEAMRAYLEQMNMSPYSSRPPEKQPICLLAALGPRMLELSAELADGAHPYWTNPEHTQQARKIIGDEKLLCVEQKVVITTNQEIAYGAAKESLRIYANLPNYRNNWKRLGFTDEDIDEPSSQFIDTFVAWGSLEKIEDRISSHYDAGADHVCLQPILLEGSYADPHLQAFSSLVSKT